MQTDDLINQLETQVQHSLAIVQELQNCTQEKLNYKANPKAWSALECIQHLVLYNNYYLPLIKMAISTTNSTSIPIFKSGMLGNYFATSMLPQPKLNKMKTFKAMNPIYGNTSATVLNDFINQQTELQQVIEKASSVNLQIVKVKTSFSSLIKLRIGDVFIFLNNHTIRHLQQAIKACNNC
jgi:hypothetical protein